MGGPVSYRRRGPSALVTIERPHARNAIDAPTAQALAQAYEHFVADDGARVLVLTGAGEESFCAGADLKALPGLEVRLGDPGGPLGFTRRPSPKPAIAAVRGWCLAGGLELALWCDVRIAAPTARLGLSERRFGVPLVDGGTQRLPRVVGLGRALDLILTGRVLDAGEALSIGLVSELADDPLERALEYAELVAGFPQEALLADRSACLAALDVPLREGLALEARGGPRAIGAALAGAARFAAGEGRGGRPLAPPVEADGPRRA